MLDESLEQVELALDSRDALAQPLELLVHLPELLVHLIGQLPEPVVRPPVLFVHAQGKAVDPAVEPAALLKNQPDNGNADAKHGSADAKNGDEFGRELFHKMLQ